MDATSQGPIDHKSAVKLTTWLLNFGKQCNSSSNVISLPGIDHSCRTNIRAFINFYPTKVVQIQNNSLLLCFGHKKRFYSIFWIIELPDKRLRIKSFQARFKLTLPRIRIGPRMVLDYFSVPFLVLLDREIPVLVALQQIYIYIKKKTFTTYLRSISSLFKK